MQLLLPTFQKYDVALAMVCAQSRANTIKIAPCFDTFMAMVNAEWWYVPHIFQLGKAKIMNLLLLCFQHEKQKIFKTIGFVTFLMVCTVISRT